MADKQTRPEKSMQPQAQDAKADVVAMLKPDHRRVEELFPNFEGARTRAQKAQIASSICKELKIHSELQETHFYPAALEAAEADEKLDEAQVEHDTVKMLVRDIEAEKPESAFYDAKLMVLKEYVKHHVAEVEGPDGILTQAQKRGIDLNEVGQTIAQRKQELQVDSKQLQSQPVSLKLAPSAKERSALPGNNRIRDSRGRDDMERFTSSRDYDDRGGRRSSSRYEDDDRGRSHSSRDCDDDDRGGGHDCGQGGRFGDSRGHSEAAGRGWEDRR